MVTPSASAALPDPPVAHLTSPVPGAFVSGAVTIKTTGTAFSGDTARSMALVVNDVQQGAAKTCVASGCPTTFTWDATGKSGPYTLKARFFTDVATGGAESDGVTVTAGIAPSVVLTSPVANSVAKSTLVVQALGTMDLNAGDKPASMRMWVDGLAFGTVATCHVVVGFTQTCTGRMSGSTSKLSGPHTVRVAMTTTHHKVISSAPRIFYAYSPVKLALARPATVAAGKSVTVRGLATLLSSGKPAHTKVTVTLAGAYGKKRVVSLLTGATGRFAFAAKIVANTTISAKIAATRSTGAAVASTKVKATAVITCRFGARVRYQASDAGHCVVPHIPAHTKVTLQYQSKKKWHALVSGTVSSSPIPISFSFGRRGTYPMRLIVAANSVYTTTYGPVFTVRVV